MAIIKLRYNKINKGILSRLTLFYVFSNSLNKSSARKKFFIGDAFIFHQIYTIYSLSLFIHIFYNTHCLYTYAGLQAFCLNVFT